MTPTDTLTTHRRRRLPRLMVSGLLVITGLLVIDGPTAAAAQEGASTSDWASVSVGGNHACGIRITGRLYCWGSDSHEQLGNGTGAGQATPGEIAGGHTDWVRVDSGFDHVCAIRGTGLLYCWGADDQGQVGNGGINANRSTPIRVNSFFGDWTHVSAGGNNTCARRSNGRLYCWGRDFNGGQNSSPREVVGAFTNWGPPSVGAGHICARRTTGRLYCWGSNLVGQLGHGGSGGSTPVEVSGSLTTWVEVTAGANHTCARQSNGVLYCWGRNFDGQLGNGGTNDRSTPSRVASFFNDWSSISAGSDHTCAQRSTGRLYCWGRDAFGALGDGLGVTDRRVPTQVSGALTTWSSVSVGSGFTCARQTTLKLFCWGDDLHDKLGNDAGRSNQHVPDEVSP